MAVYRYGEKIPKIGKNSYISDSARVIGDVTISDNCYIGHGAIVRGDYGKIIIGDGTAIEENAILHIRPDGILELEDRVIPQKSIVPDGKIAGGVPFRIIGGVEKRHKDFWTYGKQLYVDLAREYPGKFEKL